MNPAAGEARARLFVCVSVLTKPYGSVFVSVHGPERVCVFKPTCERVRKSEIGLRVDGFIIRP